MNIKITDVNFFNKLCAATIVKIEIGSVIYGLKNENSDTDYLMIYHESNEEINSFSYSHHQIQYKYNNTDYIFVSLKNYLRNLLIGDSTINFEVLFTNTMKESIIGFLYDFRFDFLTYNIARSYNGFAKRDLKHISKESGEYDKNKKIIHAIRGYTICNQILNNNIDFNFGYLNVFRNIDYLQRDSESLLLNAKLDTQRVLINSLLNENKLIKFFSIESQITLDMNLKKLNENPSYRILEWDGFDMYYIYDANENGIIY